MATLTTFEEFLEEYFSENDGRMFLDDDLPDAYESWLENLESGELMELAELAIKKIQKHEEN
jgi:hypothetical protein